MNLKELLAFKFMAYKYFLILLVFQLLFSPMLQAQHINSVTTTESRCSNSGSLTVNATGGNVPLSYQIIAGPVTTNLQSSNVFTALAPGSYQVRVVDNAGNADTSAGNIVSGTYSAMSPTATTGADVCGSSTGGYITLSFPVGQGRAPYIYTVVSGPILLPPSSPTSSTSYTFNGLSSGSYVVRVTDSCGNFQSRNANVSTTAPHTQNVNVYPRAEKCDSAIFYVQPSLGTYYPHTYYAYKDGDTTILTDSLVVTGSELVPIPGHALHQTAFRWVLPLPSTFCGGTYRFRFHDACGVTSPLVLATTGTFISANQNGTTCAGNDLVINNIQGFNYPLSVSIAPQSGGAATTKTIIPDSVYNVIFTAPSPGYYTASITDSCGRSCSQTIYVDAVSKSLTPILSCGGSLDSTKSMDLIANGLIKPYVVEITSGPVTYTSSLSNLIINKTYPDTVKWLDLGDNDIRLTNLAIGNYTFRVTDACGDAITTTVAITANGFQHYIIPPPVVSGCTGSRSVQFNSNSNCTGFFVDLYMAGSSSRIFNAQANNGAIYNNISPGTYYAYYYADAGSSVFRNPNRYSLDTNYGILHIDTFTVAATTSPRIAYLKQAKCSGLVNTVVVSDSTLGVAPYKFEITSGPGGYTAPAQASPIFSNLIPGNYTFRLSDTCGNSSIQSFTVSGPPTPVINTSGTPCIGQNASFVPPADSYYLRYWTRPNGSVQNPASTLTFNPVAASDTGTYRLIQVSDIAGCADTITTGTVIYQSCSPLPIILASFSSVATGNCAGMASWKAGMENGLAYYILQTGNDGQIFTDGTRIAATGSHTTYTQSFFAEGATTYVRLKMVDNEGTFIYSPITVLRDVCREGFMYISPNPASTAVSVLIANGPVERGKVELSAMSGQVLATYPVNQSDAKVIVNLSAYPSGIYIIRYTSENYNKVLRVTKQ